ncbi:hypothetical protein [Parvibaculum sp.]|uniref:hypothetical protein n=1 Tax=Parvibaculum sp. TaxID=2024848 RepID=UPI00272F01F4|nr:hypothetical protein [Parvibaculum sp.]MDP1626631.1 hypothetical protein [Parvibaculum sp.]MDP2150552.1 hypothetical protein [Parvibaculum sp.]MDP3327838.1 hypothetical protein [Parvibaculum sp.]
MRNTRRTSILVTAAAGALMLFAAPAFAAQLDKEIAAAAQHAGFAAAAGDIGGVHTHLHHTINCLVGPEGEGFAEKELNPCKPLGNGAIPDAEDDETRASLEEALASANAGLAEEDLDAAKGHAAETQTKLDALK